MRINYHNYVGACTLFLVGITTGYAVNVGTSITLSDNNYDANAPTVAGNWYSNREDNETELNPATITTQAWDLEGLFINDSNLSLVGGFDFKNGNLNGGHTYKSGDIFMDITGDIKYGQAANGGSGTTPFGGAANVANSFGYDYVIDFNDAMTHYTVFQITPSSLVKRVTDVPSSNPWRYVSGGVAVQGYENVEIGGYGLLAPSEYNTLTTFGSTSPGLQGAGGNNNHFFLTVDISFLPPETLTTFHYTLECGNDNLVGQLTTSSVPDSGSTVMLITAALLGLGVLRRKARA